MPQPKKLATAIHIGLGLTEDWRGYNWATHSHEQTMTQFQQALVLEPNSALANYYYGHTLQHISHLAQAQIYLKKAVTLGSDVKAAAQKKYGSGIRHSGSLQTTVAFRITEKATVFSCQAQPARSHTVGPPAVSSS